MEWTIKMDCASVIAGWNETQKKQRRENWEYVCTRHRTFPRAHLSPLLRLLSSSIFSTHICKRIYICFFLSTSLHTTITNQIVFLFLLLSIRCGLNFLFRNGNRERSQSARFLTFGLSSSPLSCPLSLSRSIFVFFFALCYREWKVSSGEARLWPRHRNFLKLTNRDPVGNGTRVFRRDSICATELRARLARSFSLRLLSLCSPSPSRSRSLLFNPCGSLALWLSSRSRVNH